MYAVSARKFGCNVYAAYRMFVGCHACYFINCTQLGGSFCFVAAGFSVHCLSSAADLQWACNGGVTLTPSMRRSRFDVEDVVIYSRDVVASRTQIFFRAPRGKLKLFKVPVPLSR